MGKMLCGGSAKLDSRPPSTLHPPQAQGSKELLRRASQLECVAVVPCSAIQGGEEKRLRWTAVLLSLNKP